MSEKQQFDPNGSGHYKAKFALTGVIKTYPRVVSTFVPGEMKELLHFKIVLVQQVLLKDGKLHGSATFTQLHESLRKTFADGFYTDPQGVIQEFHEPRQPWWLEITQIDWAPVQFVSEVKDGGTDGNA